MNCWERRKKKINKNNILVVSYATSEKTLYEFENITYKNKLIFTSLDINTPSSYHLKPDDSVQNYGMLVNRTASGVKNILDIIALCNHEDNYIRIK